jgi:hypothetical protein
MKKIRLSSSLRRAAKHRENVSVFFEQNARRGSGMTLNGRRNAWLLYDTFYMVIAAVSENLDTT